MSEIPVMKYISMELIYFLIYWSRSTRQEY